MKENANKKNSKIINYQKEIEEIENEGVSITSAPYKKYRAKNDIKFESIQYQEGEMNYYLIVI